MIYVDELFGLESRDSQAFRVGARNGHQWCHMWTDGPPEELHIFAACIGLKRKWAQDQPRRLLHYDLTPGRRERAIACGAQFMPGRARALAQQLIDPEVFTLS